MSRSYSPSGSNRISNAAGASTGLSFKLAGAPAVTVLQWCNLTAGGASTPFQTFLNGTTFGIKINIDSTPKLDFRSRSVSTDSQQIRVSTNVFTGPIWQSIGGFADFAGAAHGCWLNGVMSTGAAVYGSTSWVHGVPTLKDSIGHEDGAGNATICTGLIASTAVWRSRLSADEFAAHAAGVSPLLIRPYDLVSYTPFWGAHAPEIDLIQPSFSWAITGSVPANAENAPKAADDAWIWAVNHPLTGVSAPTAKTASDTPTAVITEARTSLKLLARADAPAASLGEARSIFQTSVPPPGTADHILTELAAVLDTEGSDQLTIDSLTAPSTLSEVAALSLGEARTIVAILTNLADAPAVALAETASRAILLARTDAPTAVITEAKTLFKTSALTDTPTVTLGEARTLLKTSARADTIGTNTLEGFLTQGASSLTALLARTDSPTWVIADLSRPLATFLARTDTPSAAVTEARTLLKISARTDTPTAVVSEARTLLNTSARADAPAASLGEARTLLKISARSDAPAVAVSEAKALSTILARTDTPTVVLGEARTSLKFLARSDTPAASISEAATKLATLLMLSASDTPTVTLAEASSVAASILAIARTDTPTATLTELATKLVTFLTLARTDTPTATISEVATKAVALLTLARTDNPSVSLGEARSILAAGQSNLAVTDNPAAALSEVSTLRKTLWLSRTDSWALTFTDIATKLAPFVALALTDNPTVRTAEATALYQAFAVVLADNPTVAISEAAAKAILHLEFSRFDVPTLSISEVSALLYGLTRPDAPALSFAEVSTLIEVLTRVLAADSPSLAVSDASQTIAAVSALSDAPTVAVDGAVQILAALARTDNPTTAITSARAIAVVLAAADALGLSLAETLAYLVLLARTDTLRPPMTEAQQKINTLSTPQRLEWTGRHVRLRYQGIKGAKTDSEFEGHW